ncbi:Iqg1p KNAG_0D00790 [Huiozyma naganishii CBS 8797]|uniref:Calponin-homology (CH) domain-containing protein n=1 Tax=Huiozyma naganishii (strain ATCC MYA-139 / BCRC 22969 / CBS 8797 / KCTC 17520 / NBRC 10181 / NCYC 3082 / Yp74L-3) TaxID=1071383 RepID=J7S6K9_HUIN7|nr:hypothetical protein KNAG_0D00790 [Kazachstania naganishii CBS 8797]CCK69831.1 hypothetical protein KNAG_0D00790 [Kazachstania naganishii CBS 8797]
MASYLDRYVQNVNSKSDLQLSSSKPSSPSKINLTPTKRLGSPLKSSPALNNISLNRENSKTNENIYTQSPSRSPLTKSSNLRSPQKIDLSQYSNEDLKYYEFLCRVGEVKRWIEKLIHEELPSEFELSVGDGLRNGVYLAKVTQRINPDLAPNIFPAGDKLQFKHTQNINAFFSLVEHVGVPDSFRFELQDLYNKKNMPQVFETLHILVTIINKKWPGTTPILSNLSGELSFESNDLKRCRKAWPKIRDFKSLGAILPSSPIATNNSPSIHRNGLINDFDNFERTKIVSPQQELLTPKKTFLEPAFTPKAMAPTKLEFKAEELTTPVTLPKTPKLEPQPSLTYKPSSYLPSPTFINHDPSLINNTPRLDYSPIKSSSLSYYSPTISKYLAYDTEFYKRRSQARTEDIEYYKSFNYSPSRYSPVRREKMTEDQYLEQVVGVQSHCRGVNTRFAMYLQNRLLNLFEHEVVHLQALCKGSALRTLMKDDIEAAVKPVDDDVPILPVLQAFLKGPIIRYRLDRLRILALRQEETASLLQARIKGKQKRLKKYQEMADIVASDGPLKLLQSSIRGRLVRRIFKVHVSNESLITLQARLRAVLSTTKIEKVVRSFNLSNIEPVIFLQSFVRSQLIRKSVSQKVSPLSKHGQEIQKMSAFLSGRRARQKMKELQFGNNASLASINVLQGAVRGILVRYTLDLVDDIIEFNNINLFQGCLRGKIIRSSLHGRSQHFIRNERSVVRVQSWIRMFLIKSAYVRLMEYPNPTLWAVRKFTHLLNGSGTIEDTQDKLESCQAALDAENIKKDGLEKDIRKKINTLKVLEDFGLTDGSTESLQHIHIPEARYPCMEKLFYLLQVNPLYWKTMFVHHQSFVEKNVYLSFTTVNQRMGSREKMYFIRFVNEMLLHSIIESNSFDSFLNDHTMFWERLLKDFLQREYSELFNLFRPVLEFLTASTTDFENDPTVIYKQIHGSAVPKSISPIADEQVKNKFIENLRTLWHAVEMVAEIFTRKPQDVPIEIKYICTKIFGYAADKNADDFGSLKAIAKILVGIFVNEYLMNWELYGFETADLKLLNTRVQTLAVSLSTIFEFNNFSGYYEPLNQYSEEIRPHIRGILLNFLLEPDYEQEGDRLIYLDMVSEVPKLEILTEKAHKILQVFKENMYYYSDKDLIRDILKDSGDELNMHKNGRLFLELNPTAYRFLVIDDKMRKLYDQTKRAFVYMTQIEEVDSSLYDLLVSSILPKDEPTFKQFLEDNKAVLKDPMVELLKPLTYFTLKSSTLKKVHELESAGIIRTSDNKLQNMLNDIANTIKNPGYAINYVIQELDVTQNTLEDVCNLNQTLSADLEHLKTSIEQLIRKCQRSKSFAPVSKGTLGNLKSAVKMVHHREGIELQGLKYKWSTRQLYEKGVIISIAGEKLAEQTVKVFGSSGPKFPDIVFRISTSDGAKFGIQLVDKRKGPEKKHVESVDSFTFTDLLNTQVGTKKNKWTLLNSKVVFNTSKLLTLVITTFYK